LLPELPQQPKGWQCFLALAETVGTPEPALLALALVLLPVERAEHPSLAAKLVLPALLPCLALVGTA
jgi:hypothetical protein